MATYNPQDPNELLLQSSGALLQDGSGIPLQGSSPQLQATANPLDFGGGAGTVMGSTTGTADTGSGTDAAKRAALIQAILSKKDAVQQAYDALFGGLDTLLKARSGELDTQYGDQLKKASTEFADVLPTIDASFAALGSYDSTQRGDNRAKAQSGYEDTVKTIGANKEKDQAALGQYGRESRAKFQADKDAALRYINSAQDTTDVNALQDAQNNVDTNLSQAGVTKATLGTDASAAKEVRGLTSDNGRFQAAIDSLDAIVKSSMPDSVKQAAVKAVTDAGGLSDEEKKKVQAQYGNVYAEQQAL